jgi:hypothetical protein
MPDRLNTSPVDATEGKEEMKTEVNQLSMAVAQELLEAAQEVLAALDPDSEELGWQDVRSCSSHGRRKWHDRVRSLREAVAKAKAKS